jgi:hypothetical protein
MNALKHSVLKLVFVAAIHLLFSKANAQVSLSLIITDNLATNAFSFNPPKPGPPKSSFHVTGDKGIQVFFYFNTSGTEAIENDGYRVRLIAYKTDQDKDEWFNETTYLLKKNEKYGIVAMNFFKPGQYKITISDNADKSKLLATGNFSIE